MKNKGLRLTAVLLMLYLLFQYLYSERADLSASGVPTDFLLNVFGGTILLVILAVGFGALIALIPFANGNTVRNFNRVVSLTMISFLLILSELMVILFTGKRSRCIQGKC
ncbi:hypothetical protein [Pollutibacter soli]|uniref:hypothetical protein n=1 Tax=Pollutibacter soli TaxID=3034157 RepID=UPI003013B292